MSANKTRLVLIIGAVILLVLLFIAPKTAPAGASEHSGKAPKAEISANANLDVYLSTALKNMAPAEKKDFDRLAAAKKTDSLVAAWDKLKRPDLASYYMEEQAKASNKAADWFKAGERYYYSVAFCKDRTEVPVLYQSAIRCHRKGLALDPKNIDAKIMLASCYVEGTEQPMEGISLLREVEKIDSNNVKLQLAFAFFSVKSGQLDKAITRFDKVLSVDSNYIEAYLHLADAYEQRGETEKTIESLEKYASRTPDVTARLEIEKYIKQLKENK